MQYNLAEYSIVNSNTDVGNVSLTAVDVLPIIQTTSASGTTIFGTDILCLDCDLGARVQIDEIRYYFSSTAVSGTVANSINFYYKNESFDIYTSLETFVSSSYYYTTIVSGVSAPRYLRMIHTVSGTSISGTVNGFQVTNNDYVVDFGLDGTTELENFEMVSESVIEEVRPIYIYNDSDVKSDAYIMLESQGTLIDEMLSISNNQTGPWYSSTNDNNVISGENIWDTGNYINTTTVFEHLELITGSGVGSYTTRVFDTMDTQKFTYLNLITTHTGIAARVATNENDVQRTIEVRNSNTKPIDYITYRKFIPYENDVEGDIPIKYKDYCMYDNSLLFTSPNMSDSLWFWNWEQYWDGDSRGRFYIDKNNRKTASLFRCISSDLNISKIFLVRMDANGVSEERYVLGQSGSIDIDTFSLLMDNNEGIWFYVYAAGVNGWFTTANRYYLAYFDHNMTEQFKLVGDSAFIYDMDIVRSNGNLWYTNSANRRLILLNNVGDILSEYEFTSGVKGVAANADGSCWVVRDSAISNINSANQVLSTIDLTSVASLLTRVAIDGDDALWVADNNFLRRVFLDGRIDFSVELEFQIMELQVCNTGVGVLCIDQGWRFISRTHRRVIKTVANGTGKNIYIGIQDAEYNNNSYANKFPIPFDTYWNNLEWNTVSVDNYLLPEDKYNQIRLTLRPDESLASPIIDGLYLNESIQLQDIYPNNYKTMYVKVDIDNHSESDDNFFDSNLKVWWYIPV